MLVARASLGSEVYQSSVRSGAAAGGVGGGLVWLDVELCQVGERAGLPLERSW